MATYKSFADITIALIEYLRLVQPDLDTKPGTVARDIVIDAPAQQLANLYAQIKNISSLQSFFSATGTDLNKLGLNFGVRRSQGTNSSGVAVFTTNNLDIDVLISQNSVVTANSGVTFQTIESITMSAANSNVYKANAARFRSDLDLIGNTDQFAVEVNVQSLIPGSSGNISKFALQSQNITGISNVTNLQPFSGGVDQESDAEFRSRILSVFAGSNTGTALGYKTTVLAVPGVEDAVVVVPGDPLMTRDGTQVTTDSSGNLIITSTGTGGKVDIYVLGTALASEIDSFIYNDKSGRQDPVDTVNDFILGQKGESTTLNIDQRRVTLIADNDLPFQPVEGIVSVVGSSSGANFVEQFADSNGTIKGNYVLIKDTGNYGGSPFGFDKLHWISNQIQLDGEEITKGAFNGIDALQFSDVQEIRTITQDVFVTNENSSINTSNRSQLTLKHTPIRTISRVVNLTTGERYVIENQNPDGTSGSLNVTGHVLISGSTLPISTDVLQVDYTWVKAFDSNYDFDNLFVFNPNRTTQDSIDWGFGNLVENESSIIVNDGYGNLTVTVTHPISKVLSVNNFNTSTSAVSNGTITTGTIVNNIIDVKRVSDAAELFNTDLRNGVLSGTNSIILPSDSLAQDGDLATLRFNTVNLFTVDGYGSGTFSGNIITLPAGLNLSGLGVLVNYEANISTLLPTGNLNLLPAIQSGNQFLFNGSIVGAQPTSGIIDGYGNLEALRKAPSNIITTTNSIVAPGSIIISGTTTHKVESVLLTATSGSGLQFDFSTAIKNNSGVTSITNYKLVRVESFERVNVNSLGAITSVDHTYDLVNYKLQDNSYDQTALRDSNLNATTFELPTTSGNNNALLITGNIIRVTFYYQNILDTELLFFSRSGTLITDKLFTTISRVTIGSGFQNAAGQIVGTLTLSNFNQPTTNSTYNVGYDYVAPKENERITITYNSNGLIDTATLAIEAVRPITADVLLKEAKAKEIDVNIRIVVLPQYQDQEQTVIQNSIDAVTSFLNQNSFGTTIDASDVASRLYSVGGIDRVTIINFSSGKGNVLSISANSNEYLQAGTVTIIVEAR